jgi:uncharacterized protein with HEPN domain
MTQHDELIRLKVMLKVAREAVEMTRGRTESEIKGDRLRILALERLLGVVGNAAAEAPQAIRTQFSQIPWSESIEMRDNLLERYWIHDAALVLRAVEQRLPRLIAQLETTLGSHGV